MFCEITIVTLLVTFQQFPLAKFINNFIWRFCQGVKLAHLPVIKVALIQQQQQKKQKQKKRACFPQFINVAIFQH